MATENKNTTPFPRQTLSEADSKILSDLLTDYNLVDKSNVKKAVSDLGSQYNGDFKSIFKDLNKDYNFGVPDNRIESAISDLRTTYDTGKKKVSTGLLEMPSQKSTTGAAIPSKEAKGTVEEQLESALGSPELAKEAMSLGTLVEQRKKEKAATIATIKNLSVTVGGQISQLQSRINAKVAEYEKANPMNFPVGGAVPMHVSVNRPQYQGYDKDAKDMLKLRSTLSLLEDAQNFIENKDDKTAFGRLVSGFKRNKDLISLGLSSLVNNMNIAETAIKAKKNGIDSLSDVEKNMLVAYGTLDTARSYNESFAYSLGDGIAQSVPFMIQMLLSGGTTASVNVAARGIAKSMLERGFATKMISTTVGRFAFQSSFAVGKSMAKGTIVAAAAPSTVSEIAKERIGSVSVTPEGELTGVETKDLGTSIIKGFSKSATEFGTEFLGGHIGLGLADVASKSKFLSKTLALTKVTNPSLKKFTTTLGYSNAIGDWAGEDVGAGIDAAIDGEDPIAAITDLKNNSMIIAQQAMFGLATKIMDVGFSPRSNALHKLSTIELTPEHDTAISDIISKSEDSDDAVDKIVDYAVSNSSSKKEAKDIVTKGVGKVAEKGVKEGNQATSDTVSEELNSTIEQHKENPTLESATDVIDAAKDAIKVKKINLDVNEDIRAINEIIDNLDENEIIDFVNQADDAIAAGDVELANQHINNIAESVKKSSQKPTELVKEEKGIEIPEEVKKPEYGAKNTLFTKDKYESSKKAIVDPKLTSGFDFNKIEDLVNIAGFHIEAGARDFVDFSKRMIDEFGETVKPYLQDVWNRSSEQVEGLEQPSEAQIKEVESYKPTPDETIQEDKGTAEAGAQTGVEGTATEDEPKVVKEKVEQAKPKEYAVQEQVADEGVLRQERPELELQEVVEGDAKQEKPSAKGEKEKLVKEKQNVALAAEIGAEQKQTIKELEAGQKQAERAISKLNEELSKVKSKVTAKGLQQSKVTAAKAVSNFFKEGKGVLPHSIYKAIVKKIVQATPSNIDKVLDDIAAMTGNVQKLQQVSRVGKLIGKLDPREGGNLASVFMQLKKLGVKGKFTYSLFKNPNQAAKVFIDGISHNIDAMPENLLNELESVLGDITKKIPDVTNLGKFIENYGEFLNEVSNKNIKEVEYSSKKVEKMVNDLVAIQDMTDYDIIGNPKSDARKVSAFNSVINNLLSNGSIEITDKGDIEAATENGKPLDPNMTAAEIAKLNKGYAASKAIPNKIGYALTEITNELESSVRQKYKAFNPKTFAEAFGEETANMVKNILLWMNDKTFKNTDISIPEWENLNEILNQINNNGFVPTALGGLYKYFGFVHKCTTQDENVVKAIEVKLESTPRFNDIGKGVFRQLVDGLFAPVSANFGVLLGKSHAYVDDFLSLTQKVAKKLFPFYENMTSSSNEAAQKMQAKIDAMNAPMIKAVADLMMEHKSAYGKGYTFIVGMPENLDPKTTKSLNKVGMLMAALRSYDLVEGQYEDKTSLELLNIADHFGNVLRRTGETEVDKQKEKFIKDNTYKYSTNEKENRLIKEQLVEVYEGIQNNMAEKKMDAIRSREDLIKLLTPSEQIFYEAVTDAYAKSQNDSFAAMLLNGEVYELENNYMPFQSAEQTEKDVKEQDVLASFLNRFTVSKAAATKYKDPNIVKAINYNPYATFLRYSRDLSRNLYIQPEYYARKKALQFLVNKNKSSKTADNVELKNVVDKFLRICNIDVDAGFRNLLNSRGQWWNTKIGIVVNGKFQNINPLKLAGAALNNMGIWHLVRIPRIVAEPVSQGFRVSPDTGISGLVKPTDSNWNAFADLNMETALTESSINKSITTPELRTTTGGFEKSKLPFAERVRLTGGAFKSVAAQQMALANRLTSKKLWTKAFNDAYKDFTGKDFDLEEYLNNEEYRFKSDTDPRFVRAKRYANRTVEAKTSSLSKITAPKSIVSWGTPKSVDWFGVEGFFGLLTVFGKYTKNMADETFMALKRAWRFKDPAELKTAMANVSSNIAYAVIVPTITYGMGIAAAKLMDDDDMFEDLLDKLKKIYSDFATLSVIQGASTLMAGGYNMSKMVAASAWYIGHAWFGEGQFKKGDIESLAAINKYRRDVRKLYEMYQLNQAFPNWYGEKGEVSFTQKAAETVLGNYMMAADAAGNTTKSIVDAINEIDKPNSERMLGAKLINAMAMTGGILLGVPFMKDLSIVSKAYIGNKWSSDPNFKRANADMQYTDQISSEAIKLIDESMAKGYERGDGIETIYNSYGFGDFKKGGMTHADNIEFLRKFDNYSRINEVKAMMLEASLKKNADKYSGKAIDILRYEGFIVGCYIGSVKDEMVMQGIDTRQEFEERYSSVFEKLPLELKENAWQIVNMSPSRKKASFYKPSGLFYSIFPQYEIDQAMKGLRKKMIEVDVAYGKGV